MIYSVSSELYHQTAVRLRDAVGSENYFSGTLVFPFDGMECRLRVSVIVYRERLVQPEGTTDAITNLVPVWWEFHTANDGGEVLNDFSFASLIDCL